MTKQLEDDLMEVGARLAAAPPDDADDLLDLLDRTEILLSRVDQSPSESVYTALQPARTALATKDLLDHSDTDVKVSVASCITEFIRITAPSPPYDDDLMKVIFQIIVGVFEKLDDFTSRTYLKRVLILETIAKVQCCVVMLDLQCDGLILEMFHYFLKTIRSSHPQNVFSSMEFIMTLVLHESEDISSDLLLCLLDSVKNDNKDVPTISHRLGEKVISNCAAKLKDYLVRVQSAFAPSEYNKIIASIYQETSDALEQNETKISGNNLGNVEMGQEVGSAESAPSVLNLPKSEMGNSGVPRVGSSIDEPSPYDGDALMTEQVVICISEEEATADDVKENASSTIDSEVKPVEVNVKRGSVNNRGDSSEKVQPATADDVKENARSAIDSEAELVETNGKRGSINNKEGDSSEKVRQTSVDDVKEDATSTIDSVATPVGLIGKRGSTKNKEEGDSSKKVQQAIAEFVKANVTSTIDSEAKSEEMNCKRGSINIKEEGDSSEKMQQATADDVKENATSTIDSEAKPVEMNGKGRSINKKEEGDSSEKKDVPYAKQRKGKGKVNAGTDLSGETSKIIPSPKSGMNTPSKDESHSEDSVRSQSRRKRPRSHEISGAPKDNPLLDQSLVGSNIKVWWPGDKRYYDGKVKSFDSKNGRHTIVYNDGDTEVLVLRKERFELLGPATEIERDQVKDVPLPLASPDGPRSKTGRANSVSKGGSPRSPSKSSGADTSNQHGSILRNLRGRTKAGSSAKSSGQIVSKSEEDTPKTGRKRGKSRNAAVSGTKPKVVSPGTKAGSSANPSGQTAGKSEEDAPKTARKLRGSGGDAGGKSRNAAVSGRKPKVVSAATNTISKDLTPKTSTKQVGKHSKTSGKPKDNPVDAQLTKASEPTPKVGRKTMRKCTKTAQMSSAEKGKEKVGASETLGSSFLFKAQRGKKTPKTAQMSSQGKEKAGESETQGSAAVVEAQQGKKASIGTKRKRKTRR